MLRNFYLPIAQFHHRHARLSLILLLSLGLLIRLPFLTTDYRISADLEDFRAWARTIEQEGVVILTQTSPLTLYPPLSLYLFGAAGFIESRLPGGLRQNDQALNALIKLPSILAEIATAGLLLWMLRGRPALFRLGTAGLYLFNPAMWYISMVWGQNDTIYTAFLAVMIVALGRQKVMLAWLAFALALCAKQQSIVLAPLLCIVTFRQYGLAKFLGGLALTGGIGLALTAPWWSTGHLLDLVKATAFTPAHINEGAYNGWYLLLLGQIHNVGINVYPAGLPLSYYTLAWGMYAAFMLSAALLVWYGSRSFSLPYMVPYLAAVMSLAAFILLPSMHERYLLPVLLCLLVAASGQDAPRRARFLWWAYGLLTITMFFNLITIGSFLPDLWTNIAAYEPPYPPLIFALKGLALLAAAINTGVFIRLAAGLKREVGAK